MRKRAFLVHIINILPAIPPRLLLKNRELVILLEVWRRPSGSPLNRELQRSS